MTCRHSHSHPGEPVQLKADRIHTSGTPHISKGVYNIGANAK